jgi:hypothetical protein
MRAEAEVVFLGEEDGSVFGDELRVCERVGLPGVEDRDCESQGERAGRDATRTPDAENA